MSLPRRQFLATAAGFCAAPLLTTLLPAAARAGVAGAAPAPLTPAPPTSAAPVPAPLTPAPPTSAAPVPAPLHAGYPAQDPTLVREMVGVSHGNLARVKELLEVSPALAGAAWDWGFGDWETALGASSHVGNREIAQLLMESGARPDLFTFSMLGYLDVVRAYVAAQPGIQRTRGPHGLTLLHHARKGGEASRPVVDYLEALGDADTPYANEPLAEEDAVACVGDYAFGPGANDRWKVSRTKDGGLGLMRYPDGGTRSLFHQREHAFHPPGNPAARITFELVGGRALGLTIREGYGIVSATRLAG